MSSNTSPKLIPRLIDNANLSLDSGELCPDEWNVFDVAQFLRVNDCANYCDAFSKQVRTLIDFVLLSYLSFLLVCVSTSIYHCVMCLKVLN